MKTHNNNFAKALLDLMNIASKDETRLHLNGVQISPLEEGVLLTATNGHTLMQVTINNPDIKVNDSIIVSSCKRNISALRVLSKEIVMTWEITCTRQILNINNMGLELVDREYPNWERLVPKKDHKFKHCLYFNADLLTDLVKSLGLTKKDHKVIKLSYDTDLSPIEVSLIKNDTDRMVLMPCKGGW